MLKPDNDVNKTFSNPIIFATYNAYYISNLYLYYLEESIDIKGIRSKVAKI